MCEYSRIGVCAAPRRRNRQRSGAETGREAAPKPAETGRNPRRPTPPAPKRPRYPASGWNPRKRSEFDTTNTELNAMAMPASIGFNQPIAATGMSTTL